MVMITVARRYSYKTPSAQVTPAANFFFFWLENDLSQKRRKTYPIVTEREFQTVEQSLVILISTSTIPFHSPNRNSLFSGAQPFGCSRIVWKNKDGD